MKNKSSSLAQLIKSISDAQQTIDAVTKASKPFLDEINEFEEFYKSIYSPNLTPLLNTITEQIETSLKITGSLMETISLPNLQQVSLKPAFTDYVNSINFEIFSKFSEFGEQLRKSLEKLNADASEIAPLLQEANLWLTPSMGYLFLKSVVKLAKSPTTTPAEIEDLFIEYFSKEDCRYLESMVNHWRKKPLFNERILIIDDALEAHKNKKYTLSIPALLPIIEGLARSIARVSTGGVKKTLRDVIGQNYPDFLGNASKAVFLNLLETIAMFGDIKSEYFSIENYPKLLEENGINEEKSLNRHAILHGVQLNYSSAINSLKVFLILDMLSELV